MSNQNYERQAKSYGYDNSNSVQAECIAVEAYAVDSHPPPIPPFSINVPSADEGSDQNWNYNNFY